MKKFITIMRKLMAFEDLSEEEKNTPDLMLSLVKSDLFYRATTSKGGNNG